MTLSLDEKTISKYRDDGFFEVHGVFAPDQVGRWLQAWYDLRRNIEDGISQLTRNDRFIVGSLPPPLGSIFTVPPLVHIAQQILGPDVALYFTRLLVKDGRWNGAVALHQDMPYFHGGQNKLCIFLPLTPFNPRNGCINFIRGSHKFGNVGIRGTILHSEFPNLTIAAPELEVGDILLCDFLTWHFSEAATVFEDRPLLQIVYQPASDGSYFGTPDEPTLVSGHWRTSLFNKYGTGITPDSAPPGPDLTASEVFEPRATLSPDSKRRYRRFFVFGTRK